VLFCVPVVGWDTVFVGLWPLRQNHSLHHRFHMDCPGNEPGVPCRDAGRSELWYGSATQTRAPLLMRQAARILSATGFRLQQLTANFVLICHSVYMSNFCPEWTFVHPQKRNWNDLKPGEPCSGAPFAVSSLERPIGTVLVENLRALLFKLRKKKGKLQCESG